MQWNRRKFLTRALIGAGVVGGLGGWWAASSRHRAARWLRRIAADARREVLPSPVGMFPRSWDDNRMTLGWVGHATVLINFYGVKILTDPVLGNFVGVGVGIGTLGPKRLIAPGLRFDDLPPVDVVLLSHAHHDHMDVGTLRRFSRSTAVVTAKETSDVLAQTRMRNVTELGWGDVTTVRCKGGELQVEAFEVRHWGRRWPSEMERGYNGYVLRREGHALIFGGDTALTGTFEDLRSRGPYEAAIMPIAAYDPWIRNHCTPEEALEMANRAGAKYIVPVHHQTFRLSNEPMQEPIERLGRALQSEPERLSLSRIGEHFVCPVA